MLKAFIPYFIFAALVLSSCGTKLSLTKRKYNRGYHLEVTTTVKAIPFSSERKAQVPLAETNPKEERISASLDHEVLSQQTSSVSQHNSTGVRPANKHLPGLKKTEIKPLKMPQVSRKYKKASAFTPLWGEAMGSVFFYVIGSILSILLGLFIVVMIELFITGGFVLMPWILPALLVLMLIAAIIAIAVLVMNSD